MFLRRKIGHRIEPRQTKVNIAAKKNMIDSLKVTLSLKRAYFFWCLEFITIFLFFCKFGVQRMLGIAGIFFASWTQTAELTQPNVLKASRFPSLFSAITRIIDVILLDIRKRLPNLVNSRWLWKISRGIWGNQQRTQKYTRYLSRNMHVFEMVKKASKRLYFLIGNKSALMSRRPICLQLRDSCVSHFVTSVPNRRLGSLHHMPHLALPYDNALASLDLELSLVVHHQRLCQSLFDKYLRGQRSPSSSCTAWLAKLHPQACKDLWCQV